MVYTSTSFPIKKPETVIKAINGLLEWLAKGKSIKSYWYEDPNDPQEFCSYRTVVEYMKDEEFLNKHGVAFLSIRKEIAMSKGLSYWEEIAEQSAKGLNQANTASLQMVMRNKFGWDKVEKEKEKGEDSNLNPLVEFFAKVSKCSKLTSECKEDSDSHND